MSNFISLFQFNQRPTIVLYVLTSITVALLMIVGLRTNSLITMSVTGMFAACITSAVILFSKHLWELQGAIPKESTRLRYFTGFIVTSGIIIITLEFLAVYGHAMTIESRKFKSKSPTVMVGIFLIA